MKLGIIFAGQGSQKIGMGKDLYEFYPEFRNSFDLLTDEYRRIAFEGTAEEIKATVNAQPILLAFGIGVSKILAKKGIRADYTCGLSLGEYTALTSAGVFSEKEAMALIQFRANAMAKASEGLDTVMSAVLGLERKLLLSLCEKANEKAKVEIANYTCPGQIVISGTRDGVTELERLAEEAGAKRTMRLSVSGPFHTSYMEPASKALAEKFKEVAFGEMEIPVIFNCIGRERENERIQDLLAAQVCSSVYFDDSIKYMRDKGVTKIIEVGPGKALSGFVKKTCRDIDVISIETAEDIRKVEKWLEK